MTQNNSKVSGRLIEFLDQGRLKPGLIIRDQADRVALLGADGREKLVSRDLILVRHSERNIDPSDLSAAFAELEGERSRLAGELDLKLFWEVVKDQGGSLSADELAELFFGHRSAIGTTVVLDACSTTGSISSAAIWNSFPILRSGSIESGSSRNAPGCAATKAAGPRPLCGTC